MSAFSTTFSFYIFLLCTHLIHLLTFITLGSFTLSSSHIIPGLPFSLVILGFHIHYHFFTYSIYMPEPTHSSRLCVILFILNYLVCLFLWFYYSKTIQFLVGPVIFLRVFLSNTSMFHQICCDRSDNYHYNGTINFILEYFDKKLFLNKDLFA